MGPTGRAERRADTLARMVALLEEAAARGARLAVFPELAFTPFFPRWPPVAEADLAPLFERTMPNDAVRPLFDRAWNLDVGLCVGFAEELGDGRTRFDSAIAVGPDGRALDIARKVHLPGTVEPIQDSAQRLDRRLFAPGPHGFRAFRGPTDWHHPTLGVLVGTDRRWPEAWRCLGLAGAELVLVPSGSAARRPYGSESRDHAGRAFAATLLAQANALANGTWAVHAARAGMEDGVGQLGGSLIVHPEGVVVAQARTDGDEVVVATADLDACRWARRDLLRDGGERRPEHYRPLVEPPASGPPP